MSATPVVSTQRGISEEVLGLRELMVSRLDAMDRALEKAFDAHAEKHTLSAVELNRLLAELASKLFSMNEFRGALSDAQAQFVQRSEVTVQVTSLNARLDTLETTIDIRLSALERKGENLMTRDQVGPLLQPASVAAAENSRRLNAIENMLSNLQGRLVIIGGILALIPILISIALHFIR